MADAIPFPRHGIAGYYALADLPQSAPLSAACISTGWTELDQIFRIYPGQFVVVTGNAGGGKSTFLFNLIINICWTHKKRAWLYVPENELNLLEKIKTMFAEASNAFNLFASDYCFVQSSSYQHYNDEPRDIEWILGHAWECWKKDLISIVMIDPWNELERAKQRDELLTDYIGRCLMRVKMFAKETLCTLFMVAHPTKAAIGRDVTLYDVEGSAHWVNKCDNGLIVKRNIGGAKVVSAKVREQPHAGRLGHCIFVVDEESGIFREQQGGGQVL